MSTSCGAKVSKVCCIPQRWVLAIMGSLGLLNAYAIRVTLSMAITEMVLPHEEGPLNDTTCPIPEGGNVSSLYTVTDKSSQYNWDEETQGLILSSFYWGYIISHMPGGILSERYGGKHTLGLGMLLSSVATLAIPWLVKFTKGTWWSLVILRALSGLGQGTAYPAMTSLLGQWVPLEERTTIGAIVYAGSQLGTILSNSVSAQLIYHTESWASVFYLFGGLGVIWYIFWQLLCYSYPDTHPFIKEKEQIYLGEKLQNVQSGHRVIPWCPILKSIPLWAAVMAQIGQDWGFTTMVTDLPKYFKEVLRFKVDQNGIWSSVPYFIMWMVSMISGFLSDWMIKNKYIGVAFARKLFNTIASLFPSIFMMVASYVGCDRVAAVVTFTVAIGLMGTFHCGMKVNIIDLSPNYSGTLMAIANGIGALASILAPYIVGVVTTNHTLGQWRLVFWIAFAVFNVTNLLYVIFGSGAVQWWNDPALFQKTNDGGGNR